MHPSCGRAWCVCAVVCVPLLGFHAVYSRPIGGATSVEPAQDAGLLLDGDDPVTGKRMPRIGFGTCCRRASKGAPLIASTLEYLSQGGRLIDTAQMYENHKDLKIAIQRSQIPRDQLWITSKVMTIRGALSGGALKGGALKAATISQVGLILTELGVDYVDLMLLHHAKNNSPDERTSQWKGLLAAKERGQVKHAGVSNFDRGQIESLREATGVLPAVNQLEYHPFVSDETHGLVQWCQRSGIAVTAYGSLGSSSTGGKAGDGVGSVAARHGVTSAAVLLRWALSKGCAIIPGATSASHIFENLHIKQLSLTAEDEATIRGKPPPRTWRMWNNMAKADGSPLKPRKQQRS